MTFEEALPLVCELISELSLSEQLRLRTCFCGDEHEFNPGVKLRKLSGGGGGQENGPDQQEITMAASNGSI